MVAVNVCFECLGPVCRFPPNLLPQLCAFEIESFSQTIRVENLRREGFIYRKVCFGTTRNRETGKEEYKRIEVFKRSRWTRAEWFRMDEYFKRHISKGNLAIFVIQGDKLYAYPLGPSR